MNEKAQGLVGQVIDARYRIDVLVARGGMASVYRAHDLRLDRTVAVKVMNRSLAEDPSFVTRFKREAQAAARLSHPNLVSVFDQGDHDGLVWLAMDYVQGHTLRQVIDIHAPLDPDRALGVTEQILEGLSAAHAAGFVHRDVKPENVLMTTEGVMRLVDFGLTRALTEDSLSRETKGVVLGTVAYMAPEQVEVARTDERSDIYATGVVLFEMLTGTPPFTGSSPLAVAYRHVHEDVPAPSTVTPGIPPDVDELVLRATAKEPSQRYLDAQAFLAAVRAADLDTSTPAVADAGQHEMSSSRPHSAEDDPLTNATVAVGAPANSTMVAAQAASDTSVIAPAGTLVARAPKAYNRTWEDIAGPDGTKVADGALGPGVGSLAADRSATTFLAPHNTSLLPPDYDAVPPTTLRRVRSSRRFSRTLLTAFLLLVTGLVAVGSWWFGTLQTTSLIDVRGMTVAEADQRLAVFGVDIGNVAERYDAEAAAGTIISTDPQPDARVRSGALIDAVVSLGPEPRQVPGVVGMSEAQAVAELEAAGFTVAVEKTLPFVLVDRIYSQSPASGTELTDGSTVTINLV